MRVALAQINTTVGDFEGNRARIEAAYRRARSAGADLVMTPELALAGYPPRDLLERRGFAEACGSALRALAAVTTDGGGLLVGVVAPNDNKVGRPVFNSAALLADGVVTDIVHKSLLPTYDVFDEARYFEAGNAEQLRPLAFRGRSLGVTLCEDLWNDPGFWDARLYALDPARKLAEAGADVLLNLSASPFHLGKGHLRRRMLSALAKSHGLPVLQCNLVGGNDDLVFDGGSLALGSDGSLQALGTAFTEDLVLVDLDSPKPTLEIPSPPPHAEQAARAVVLGIRDYFEKCGFQRAVIGLSGGIDSAVTAALAARALGSENVTGITMPSRYSSTGSVEDSRSLASLLGIPFHVIPVGPAHDAYHSMLSHLWASADLEDTSMAGLTDQNIQARIRGNILMAWSNRTGALVLSTGNKSELAVGYCTLYGDMAGGLAAISDLPKTLVYEVARWLNQSAETIPEATLTKPPSAELAPDQLDTDSLPPYEQLDPILHGYLEEGWDAEAIIKNTGADPATVHRILHMVDRNEFKRRQAAPGLRVTSKAFGQGRRYPVAARFNS
ncbi:MAG: NAD+ synthase [Deltaproteobacteria bacterium]|nr:NAD+ synthase [Deltaproteobacteria bacterium]